MSPFIVDRPTMGGKRMDFTGNYWNDTIKTVDCWSIWQLMWVTKCSRFSSLQTIVDALLFMLSGQQILHYSLNFVCLHIDRDVTTCLITHPCS